ncbi:hypothetical protein J6590_073911 [Homalodisca vitripennis]|nr:hypothetical protein J6590_073911 [Homalodisca vitripennis]
MKGYERKLMYCTMKNFGSAEVIKKARSDADDPRKYQKNLEIMHEGKRRRQIRLPVASETVFVGFYRPAEAVNTALLLIGVVKKTGFVCSGRKW